VLLLSHSEADVRSRAATALGHVGPYAEANGAALRALAEDPAEDPAVQRAAQTALRRIDLMSYLMEQRGEGVHVLPLVQQRLVAAGAERRLQGLRGIALLGPAAAPALEDVRALVADGDARVRLAAVHGLAMMQARDPESIAVIAAQLGAPELQMRRTAARSLAGMGGAVAEPASEALVGALADEDSAVRGHATTALLAIEPSGTLARAELRALLSHPNTIVRNGAAEALAGHRQHFPAMAEEFAALLRHEDEPVRLAAARGLVRMGEEAVPALPELRALLAGDDARMRGVAANTIAHISGSREAVGVLASQLDAADRLTRLQAIQGLETQGPPAREHTPTLLAFLRTPDLQEQQAAARALVALHAGDPEPLLPKLLAMLEDPDVVARTGGAIALGSFGEASAVAVDPLIALLDDPRIEPRAYAIVALGEIGPSAAQALPRLKPLQSERDYRISGFARRAVSQIRGDSPAARRW
jgi:HEAT repeat protein